MSLHSRCRVALCLAALLIADDSAAAASERIEFDIAGEPRSALLFAPTEATDRPPLVLVFHGRGDDSSAFARAVRLHRDWPQAVVVYPNGRLFDGRPASRGWQHLPDVGGNHDLVFVDRLLAELHRRYRGTVGNAFAAGFSNGGRFVFVLMAARAEAFAGFAAIGTVQPDFTAASKPKPLMYLFGRREDDAYREAWAETVQALARHQRAGDPQTEYLSCCRRLDTQPGGASMVFGMYNAGHVWPHDGNRWLRQFFTEAMTAADGADESDDAPITAAPSDIPR